jgi:membrane protein insertase Oxa1/YidC/SpoIIIJ
MVVNSITSIGQQYYLNRKLGIKPAPAKIAAKA